ncbi:Ferritin-like [Tenacibaculum sp. MAR_2009_124]|uniref:ferritin-like domain-containing protein n=1 Tax=Tenacibaculum sp. MAR_2009_124 TaxID=1250059 RepID=UPI00089442E3|nr:ferritin-like protein [Tenacibaculum sp. MAR_2009_124]SED18930.1 Ferritin-like [Tenacibaculum sp. MAR_2009_124]
MPTTQLKYKNAFQEKASQLKNTKELIDHSRLVEDDHEDKLHVLKELLNQAVVLEFATIPIYMQTMWSIKDNNCEVAKSIRNVFQEEMLHMAMVCNMIAGLGGEPKIYDPENSLKFPSGLPGGVHPDLFLYLEGLSDCSLRNFMEIELPEKIADIYDYETKELITIGGLCDQAGNFTENKIQNFEHNTTIGELYDRVNELFQDLQPKMNVERQLAGPLSWWVMADAESVSKAIDMIKEQGEGSEDVSPASTGMDNLAHFYRFWEVFYQKKIVQEEEKYYFKDPMPRPETYPLARVPKGGYQQSEVSNEVWHLLTEFDKAYTSVVQLLEEAWAINGRGQAALVNAIEAMFKLERYAIPLVKTPIPNHEEGLHYGPCFRMI